MANQAVQDIAETGLNPSFVAAAAGGDDFINGDRTFFVVKNSNATLARTVTFAVQRTSFDIDKFGKVTFAALAINIPLTSERWVKAPLAPYTDGNGKVQVTYSDSGADLTVAAVRMPGG